MSDIIHTAISEVCAQHLQSERNKSVNIPVYGYQLGTGRETEEFQMFPSFYLLPLKTSYHTYGAGCRNY